MRYLLAFPFLIACGASMVQEPGGTKPVANAPVNEVARPGVVMYLNEGIASVKAKRRANAYAQMKKACGGGEYRIDSEGPRVKDGVVVPDSQATAVLNSQYWFIQFSCATPYRSSGTPRYFYVGPISR
jgi:hypothetical protein